MQLYGAQTSGNLKNIPAKTVVALKQQTAYSAARTNAGGLHASATRAAVNNAIAQNGAAASAANNGAPLGTLNQIHGGSSPSSTSSGLGDWLRGVGESVGGPIGGIASFAASAADRTQEIAGRVGEAYASSWSRAGDWWEEHGDKVLLGASLVAMAVCIAASAGACLALSAVVITATIIDGKVNRGWSNEQAVGYGLVSVLTLGVGGGALSSMTHVGMSATRVTAAGANALHSPIAAYVGVGVVTNLPGVLMQPNGTEG